TVALELLPASQPVPETVQTLMERPEPLRIPAADAPELLADLVPQMRDVVDVTSQDGSVEFPAPQPPQLLLSLEHGPGQVSSCAGPGATAPCPASCPCTGRSAPRDGTRTTRTRCSPRCASSGPAGTARISR